MRPPRIRMSAAFLEWVMMESALSWSCILVRLPPTMDPCSVSDYGNIVPSVSVLENLFGGSSKYLCKGRRPQACTTR